MLKSNQERRAIRDRHMTELKAELTGMNQVQLRGYLAGWLASLCATLGEDDERLNRLENSSCASTGCTPVSDATDELPLC
jgi:hypothetical protein